ncbi:MAG: hypothetical protein JJT89_14500 [Nitriliruptoraceae bacterium]|nr:hypothetical protein [Nitriliruptoraceae bacterium]
MTEPVITTEAQARTLQDTLAWGRPRPPAPPSLAPRLQHRLEQELAALGPELGALTAASPGGRLVLGRGRLARTVCDGWQLAPRPFVHDADNVRGVLAVAAICADLDEGRVRAAADVATRTWDREASARPGDPRARSAWLNAASASRRASLLDEVAELVETFREVWPVLPASAARWTTGRVIDHAVGGGGVVLRSAPGLTLGSPVEDDRARSMIVDLRTGRPRAPQDRDDLRSQALVHTLAAGRPPFRWVTFYVTEGRAEVEDLDAAALEAGVDRVVATVRQLLRLRDLPADAPDTQLRLDGGAHCTGCRRAPTCPLAPAGPREP